MNPIFMSILKYLIGTGVVVAILYSLLEPVYSDWKKKKEGKENDK